MRLVRSTFHSVEVHVILQVSFLMAGRHLSERSKNNSSPGNNPLPPKKITPPKINMSPEKGPCQKENKPLELWEIWPLARGKQAQMRWCSPAESKVSLLPVHLCFNGIFREAYHKGVPLLGVPENPIDCFVEEQLFNIPHRQLVWSI